MAHLMAELDRLEALDMGDEDAVKLEVSRAQAVGKLATAANQTGQNALAAARLNYEMGHGDAAAKGVRGMLNA